MEQPYSIRLEAYEGPLDLLLDLIRKQEINIYDIPIAHITGQYLEYVRQHINLLDTEVAGEFLLMAATLIHIKSRMLLPPDPDANPADDEDPRAELVHQLLEHEKFRRAAQMLQEKQLVQSSMWSAPDMDSFLDPEAEPALAVTLYDVVRAFQQILERAKQKPLLEIESEKVTVAEMMQRVCEMLAERSGPLLLPELVGVFRSRDAIVAIFLALLELIRLQAVAIRQLELFGEIVVRRHTNFTSVAAGSGSAFDETYQ